MFTGTSSLIHSGDSSGIYPFVIACLSSILWFCIFLHCTAHLSIEKFRFIVMSSRYSERQNH